MNSLVKLLVVMALAVQTASAAETDVSLPDPSRLPGVALAETVTQLTGVAISPLLGVSAVGAWQYFQAPEASRASLPWFCQPYSWGLGFCVIGLCFLKDLFGTAAPPLIKKPLDFVELFEDKLSALVACSAFLPFIVTHLAQPSAEQVAITGGPVVHFASVINLSNLDPRFILIPVAIVGFLMVWLSCHAINVLIALCPFGIIDSLLKLFKGLLLSAVVASSFISPFLGVAVSLVIIVAAAWLAPWAFRLTVFGTLFGLDILLPKRGRRHVSAEAPQAFLARPVADVPVRSYGRLTLADNGDVCFAYRPWLILPERSIPLPAGNVALAKGLLFPSLLHRADEQQRQRIMVMFLPRYRSHEPTIAEHFQIVDIQESPLLKGLRSVRTWLVETLSLGKRRIRTPSVINSP